MTAIIIITLYIINVFLNRWIYFSIVKLDNDHYPNPAGFMCFFLSLLGTIILSFVLIELWFETLPKSKFDKFNFFKPKFLK